MTRLTGHALTAAGVLAAAILSAAAIWLMPASQAGLCTMLHRASIDELHETPARHALAPGGEPRPQSRSR